MHIYQIILPAIMVVAFIGACIKAPRQTIGGVIGGSLGLLIPFLFSELYVWRGGDPTAAGAVFLSVFSRCRSESPLVFIVTSWMSKGRGASDKDKV